jgi:CubicO group peptidase (beta-lactamase class C family)
MQVQTETRDPESGKVAVETKDATRPITIRDLLRHTAGLTYGFFGNTQVDKQYRDSGVLADDRTIAETVEKLGKIPLRFEPGTQWHYSTSVDA